MLWNVVFEFFIKYVFGGFINTDSGYRHFDGMLGILSTSSGTTPVYTYNFYFTVGDYTFSLGNYLSLIATIISMVVILVLCCALIKKIYNICAHVIG